MRKRSVRGRVSRAWECPHYRVHNREDTGETPVPHILMEALTVIVLVTAERIHLFCDGKRAWASISKSGTVSDVSDRPQQGTPRGRQMTFLRLRVFRSLK